MKKLIIFVAVLIGLVVAWYLISPAFIVKEANEPSPLEMEDEVKHEVDDSLGSMDAETRAEFDAAVEEMKDVVVEMQDEMPAAPAEPQIVAQGIFVPRDHEVEGQALLIEHDGKKTLRFEDFDTINGPNLHIYLSRDLSENDFVDLGPIKATKGNVNYELEAGIDTDKYNKVLVWCVPFRVLFSYAELN